jgi:hypothetical protein
MPQICGYFDGRGASAHHDDAKPLFEAGCQYLSSCSKEILDRLDGINVFAGWMEEIQRDLAPRVEGDGIVPDLGSRTENQDAPDGIDQDHPFLDERCPPVFRHLFHVEAGLGRPVDAGEQAGTHPGIIVIPGRADQRDAVTGPYGITQTHHRRQVGVAAAHENQVLRHLPLSRFEDPLQDPIFTTERAVACTGFPVRSVFYQRTVIRKIRRGPTAEAAEQRVVPGPTPLNPSPPGTSTGMAIFGSSQRAVLAGQTIWPEVHASNVSPTRSSIGNGSSCARAWGTVTKKVPKTNAMPARRPLRRMFHLRETGMPLRYRVGSERATVSRTGNGPPPRRATGGKST